MSIRRYFELFDIEHIDTPVERNLGLTPYLFAKPTTPILFKTVDGFTIIGNLWSTHEHIARALDIPVDALIPELLKATAAPYPCTEVENAPFMANIRSEADVDLHTLPVPTYFKGDGGPYITAAVVTAEHEGVRNMSFHRLMVRDQRTFGIRLVPRHLHQLYKNNLPKDLPVGIAIGVCPPILLAGATSVEFGIDELEIASALRKNTLNEPVSVINLPNGVRVPAEAEFVLEGRITTRTAPEGPFVDITGTYDIVREQPIVEIDRVYHRDDPIFHALLPGGHEHYLLMGLPREATMFEKVSEVAQVKSVRLQPGGCSWLHGAVAIVKKHDDDGQRAIEKAIEGHRSMKHVVIVDDDIDVHNPAEVEWAIATRFQADRDLMVFENVRGSTLDPSSKDGIMTKLGFDATVPIAEREKFKRERP